MTRCLFSVISWLSCGVAGAFALLAVAACTEPVQRTQVMLIIDADESLRSRIRYVDIEVRSGLEDEPVWDLAGEWQKVLRDDASWPIKKSLVRSDNRTGYLVTAVAKDVDDVTVGTQRALSMFAPGKTLELRLRFDEACLLRASPCSKTFTCRQGRCIDPYVDAEQLGVTEPGSDRGGVEAAPVSPGMDVPIGSMPTAGAGSPGAGDLPAPPVPRPPPPACQPGEPGCPTAACPTRDDQGVCQTCPVGFVDSSEGCLPLLTALALSEGTLVPSFDPSRTSYTAELPLLAGRATLDLEAAGAIEIMVDGEPLTTSRWTGPVELGDSELAITLSASGRPSRTYRLKLRRSGAQLQRLTAAEGGPGDNFGVTVAASGDRLVVGAPYEDGVGEALTDSGAAYVFERRDTGWKEVALLRAETPRAQMHFGFTVAIDGDRIVVAAPEEPGGGAIHVFEPQGDTWAPVARFSGERTGLLLGRGLAIQGDLIVAGAPGDDEGATAGGAAQVIERRGGVWSRTAILRPMVPGPLEWFGSSVTLDGNTLLVSATGRTVPGESLASGAAFVFERDGTDIWREVQMFWQVAPVANGFWGEAISLRGDRLLGAGFYGYTSFAAGTAAVFSRGTDGQFAQDAVLRPSNSRPGDSFGVRVQLTGDTAIVGAYTESSAAPGVGAAGTGVLQESGAVYLFEPSQGEWTQVVEIKSDVPVASEGFGRAVVSANRVLFVGAPGVDTDTALPGSVYVFR